MLTATNTKNKTRAWILEFQGPGFNPWIHHFLIMQPWTNCVTVLLQNRTNFTSLSYCKEQMRKYMQSGQGSDQESMDVESKIGECSSIEKPKDT